MWPGDFCDRSLSVGKQNDGRQANREFIVNQRLINVIMRMYDKTILFFI
jgi:hypothetical protein